MNQNSIPEPDAVPEKSSANLFRKVVHGGFWVSLLRILTQFLVFIQNIILLNFIVKDDIGILGLATMMIQAYSILSETGFRSYLIQKNEKIHSYLDTVWTIGIIRGIALTSIFYLTAPYLAQQFATPEKISLTISTTKIMSLSFFLTSLSNIGLIYFRKELQFNRYFIFDITSNILNIVASTIIIIVYQSIWGLIIGKLAGDLIQALISYIAHPYRPRLKLNLALARQMWKHSHWISYSIILGFIWLQGDDLFVLSYFGMGIFGYYSRAYRISNLPATELSGIITDVTFPAFAKLQNDPLRLKDAYIKVQQFTVFLSIPLAGMIAFLTPDFSALFIKNKPDWQTIVPAMQALAIFGLLRTLNGPRWSLFLALNRTKINFYLQVLQIVLLAIFIYPASVKYGVTGSALAVLAVTAITQPIGTYLTIKLLRCSKWEIIKPTVCPLLASLFMVLVMYVLRNYTLTKIGYLSFFAQIIIGTFAYLVTAYVLDKLFNFGIEKNIRSQLAVLIKK